ncbi:MAG: 23S rRNA (guanosine(2251)-2'-O)-methyltransferase RlmB [Bacteroidia bacterium]|nr:23S rRNA (guanosine(2251)-2'-O)-methyltransferase RlmB [Bacteroidia bacterium]MDW8332838.1 23S rRNA (guanosine(2251)-2'-O)-methyltransferase RlmB [Bacteroidia bacterium]
MNDEIYGLRAVEEALDGGRPIDKVLIRRGMSDDAARGLVRRLRRSGVPYQIVPYEALERLFRGKNHQGVAAYVAPTAYADAENIVAAAYDSGKIPLLVYLDGVTDVRNFGAVARSAECFGADALILPALKSVRLSPDAVKASAGALMRLPVCRAVSPVQTLRRLKASGLKIVLACEHAKRSAFDFDPEGPVCYVFGGESRGASPETVAVADERIRIPTVGSIGSLNVAVAAGIVLALEAHRRISTRSSHPKTT